MIPEPTEALLDSICERLTREVHRGQFAMGGGSIDSAGKGTMWGGEKIMEYANPDGPTIARELRELVAAMEAAREPEAGKLREALEIIADNNSWRGFSPQPTVERMRETARTALSRNQGR